VSVYYGYQEVILGSQSTVGGVAQNYAYAPTTGAAWSYSGGLTSFHVRENDGATLYNGDTTTQNEVIGTNERFGGAWEQVANVGGTYYQTIWDYTFRVQGADGTNYDIGVVDIDFDGDNTIDLVGENGYYLIFTNGVPPPGTDLSVIGIVANTSSTPHTSLGANIVCFGHNTRIATPSGPVPVQSLKPGDLVVTGEGEAQPILWTGKRRVAGRGRLAPIVFAPNAMGNDRKLVLSRQHRVLAGGWQAELLFGSASVLVKAKDLVNGTSIRQVEMRWITYYHILLDGHQVVYAEGVPAESFHPGASAISSLDQDCAAELLDLFPELHQQPDAIGPCAHLSLKQYEARCLNVA